jgi:multicomponent K+:H+ antiporter subunit E
MKRAFPQPVMSVVLLLTWLLLNQTVHIAHWLLGGLLAWAIPHFTSRVAVGAPRVQQWLTVVVLTVVVVIDILKSNIAVAKIILGLGERPRPAYVWVPLSIRDAHGRAVLAGIITMTPGTLSIGFSDDEQYLLVHALDVADTTALIAEIKQRYEMPLMEIFE